MRDHVCDVRDEQNDTSGGSSETDAGELDTGGSWGFIASCS
jgi:hypothetical protein